jgi:hypothetical protein
MLPMTREKICQNHASEPDTARIGPRSTNQRPDQIHNLIARVQERFAAQLFCKRIGIGADSCARLSTGCQGILRHLDDTPQSCWQGRTPNN